MMRNTLLARCRHLIWLMLILTLAACNLNTTSEDIPQVVDGPPVVVIASPLPNAAFLDGVGVNIQARVSTAGADVTLVEVAVDDTVIASLEAPNAAGSPAFSVSQSWQASGSGSHVISVTAYKGEVASEPATVSVNVVSQVGGSNSEQTEEPEATEETQTGPPPAVGNEPETSNTAAPAATETPSEPTVEPTPEATNTPSVPTGTFTTGVNVRRGPGTNFEPPIGSFAANQTSEVLAVSPDRSWYKVKYYNGEGWVFSSLMTVSGNVDNLAVDPGPPTPIPVTNTPIPPTPVPVTATPTININLVAGNIRLDPDPPRCARTFNITFDVLNAGSDRWNGGGKIEVVDTASGNTTRTEGAIPGINANQTVSVGPIPITVSTNFEEEHTITITINPDNQVPEGNKDDNRRELKYTLRKGDC